MTTNLVVDSFVALVVFAGLCIVLLGTVYLVLSLHRRVRHLRARQSHMQQEISYLNERLFLLQHDIETIKLDVAQSTSVQRALMRSPARQAQQQQEQQIISGLQTRAVRRTQPLQPPEGHHST